MFAVTISKPIIITMESRRRMIPICAVAESFLISLFSVSLFPCGTRLAFSFRLPSSSVFNFYTTCDVMKFELVCTLRSLTSGNASAQLESYSVWNASSHIQGGANCILLRVTASEQALHISHSEFSADYMEAVGSRDSYTGRVSRVCRCRVLVCSIGNQ